ncbi:hypothetical protein [Pseudonocardia sp. ICBG1293]|uniref:hypothetical protein n=1 Tax=Pseudonocardia sp. ICBG1293 TaxID=2844382 RepID=UPI001CCF1D10|nr:hypothetical protein [Pseudonocardia sp. ICBG1293]
MPYEVVSAYTLVLGEHPGDSVDPDAVDAGPGGPDAVPARPEVSVHTTAEDAWRALDAGVRERCGMRPRPRRRIDPDAVVRLADAWRAGDPGTRYWQVTAHRLPIMVPELARAAVAVR